MSAPPSAPPFTNSYRLREVASSDSKSCYVCYKPTNKVLLSENKVDFFYVCPSHLKDVSFAKPIHSEEYNSLIKEKSGLIVKIADLEADQKNLGYNWDIMSKIPGFSKKEDPKPAESDKDAAAAPPPVPPKKDHKSIEQELSRVKAQLDELTAKIDSFPFKEFTLDKDIYRNRVRGHVQVKFNQKRQQEMQKPGFFPSVPTSGI